MTRICVLEALKEKIVSPNDLVQLCDSMSIQHLLRPHMFQAVRYKFLTISEFISMDLQTRLNTWSVAYVESLLCKRQEAFLREKESKESTSASHSLSDHSLFKPSKEEQQAREQHQHDLRYGLVEYKAPSCKV